MLPRVHEDVVAGQIASVASKRGEYFLELENKLTVDNPEIMLWIARYMLAAEQRGMDPNFIYTGMITLYDMLRIQDEVNELENV